MFSVIFEVLPNRGSWDDYLDNAKMLRPELEQVATGHWSACHLSAEDRTRIWTEEIAPKL